MIVFLVAAWLVYNTPYIYVPFKWFETYFHELSHGIAALLAGGSVDRLALNFDGSGTIFFSDLKMPGLVAFFGYFGAFIWGAAVYLAASSLKKFSSICAASIAVLVLVTAAMWIRDIQSAIVALTILSVLVLLVKVKRLKLAHLGLRFIGIYVIVAAMYSPLMQLFAQSAKTDALVLREMTWIPEIFWIAVWMLSGILILWMTYRLEGRQDVKKPEVVAPSGTIISDHHHANNR